ncbi:DUF262 domain-containing protein [Hymenobacter cellulosilyticus]|uniref:DUF262 domain-containing protein n=1 Tax=Hymenobacter cellulosilyticus TaxID=2932248 RepID=A0A8T9QAB9_9BACT|nr:DUF262 domain-containing protein [Hymenobacter cellulosilyticus]UOQ74095.1 DUF262 domain-containing protein [Hymenobacter cellulosilyticus]
MEREFSTEEISSKTEAEIVAAEEQIKSFQIPYEYDTKEYPIDVMLFRFNSNAPEKSKIRIPGYQRSFIWRDEMKCRFIESLFMGVPIQPLFAAILDKDGTLELIDGSQRIRTIEAFVNNEFTLNGLKKLTYLNGFKYSDLPESRRNKFELINIRLHVISDKAEEGVRHDIFDRINTTGERAKPAEVRKGAFAGDFYKFIEQCTKDELFKELCPISESARKRGEAEELVLRFFTYSEFGTNRKERGSRVLDSYLIEKNNGFDIDNKTLIFNNMLNFVRDNFPLGFRKTPNANSTPRVRFEAISLGVHFALEEEPKLVPKSMDWLNSLEFNEVTTSDSSGNAGKLKKRVDFVKDCLVNKIKPTDLHYEGN